jgi:hypothetical protein
LKRFEPILILSDENNKAINCSHGTSDLSIAYNFYVNAAI